MAATWIRRSKHSWKAAKNFISNGMIDPLPLRHYIKGYTIKYFGKDIKAATDVALVGIPQSMAFAAMAGLPSIYGIMAGAIGTLVAPFFARCSIAVSGPSNATAFMLASFFLVASPHIQQNPHIFVPLIIFFAGLACVVGAFVKATEMLQFVNRSVLVGYITGAATLMIASQMRYVLGLNDVSSGSSFFEMAIAILENLKYVQWQPAFLAGLSLVLYFIFKRYLKWLPNFALILVLMSILNWILCQPWTGGAFTEVRMLSDFTMSDLSVQPPRFELIFDNLAELFPIIIGIAFLSSLEQTVMSKTLAAKTGEPLNINQDTFSVGMANIASSFSTCLPSSASLTRSILNYNSGAKTRFSAVYCGLIGFGIIFVLANVPLISFIPHTVLAALVLANALALFDKKQLRICYRSTPGDAAVLIATFIAALMLPLHIAIFIGVVISVSLFLRKASKPELSEYTFDDQGTLTELDDKSERVIPQISIVHVEGDIFFGASDLFRRQVARIVEEPSLAIIVLRMRNARNLDATSVFALEELITFTREQGRHLIISGASREVYRILRKSGVLNVLQANCSKSQSNIFLTEPRNPNVSTRRALMRAQELIGTGDVDISIYTTTKKEASK